MGNPEEQTEPTAKETSAPEARPTATDEAVQTPKPAKTAVPATALESDETPTPKRAKRQPTPTPTPVPTVSAPAESVETSATATTESQPVRTEGAPLIKPEARVDYQMKASASVSPSRDIYPSDRSISYTVLVSWNGKPNEITPSVPEKPELDNLTLVEGPEKKTRQTAEGMVEMLWTWTVRPDKEGNASIGAIVIPSTTKTGQNLEPLRVDRVSIAVGGAQGSWLGKIIAGVIALVFVIAAVWGLLVVSSVQRKKRYQEAVRDSMPSGDERLLSELATLQVSLLRGNVFGYYEKLSALVRNLLKLRGVIDRADLSNAEIVERSRAAGVDPAFLELFESILRRCEAAMAGERPDQASHEKIAQDMKVLVRMKSGLAPVKPKAKNSDDASNA